jgi:predicted GIY-YIG superfamily endonuclease
MDNLVWSKFHRFTSGNVLNYTPWSGGVYILWVQLNSGNWICYYVGQAENLKQRLSDHLSNIETNICIKRKVREQIVGFETANVSKQNDRDGIVKFLYDHFKPECNAIDPGGKPIAVNLP